jgi:hypothetical protein
MENFRPEEVENRSVKAFVGEVKKKQEDEAENFTKMFVKNPDSGPGVVYLVDNTNIIEKTHEKPVQAEFQRGEENQESGEDEQLKGMDRESL